MGGILMRCKHCGSKYVHYDNRTTFEFCENCVEAMNAALEKVPVKFVGMFRSVDDTEEVNFVLAKCEENYNRTTCYFETEDVKLKEEIQIGGSFYRVFNRGMEDQKIERLDEYSLMEHKFTGEPWCVDIGFGYKRTRGFKYCDLENPVNTEEKTGVSKLHNIKFK